MLVTVLISDEGWLAIPGAVLGLLAVFTLEWALNVRSRLARLEAAEKTLAIERRNMEVIVAQSNQRVLMAERTTAVSEAWMEVWGGALRELPQQHQLPLPALMARADMILKSRNIHTPVDPEAGARIAAGEAPSAIDNLWATPSKASA